MSLQTKPIDTSVLEFRFNGASEYKAFNQTTRKKEEHQAIDDDSRLPIYSIRCQVVYREMEESGIITVRVPLAIKPDLGFEDLVQFEGAHSKDWAMEGNQGQTWTAKSMTVASSAPPVAPSSSGTSRKKAEVTA